MRSVTRFAALLVVAAPTLVAQEPPAAETIRARVAPVAANPIPVEQVRALVAAHHPDIASGQSDDNSITFVFDSNGGFVTSGSAKLVGTAMVRAGDASAGGSVVAATRTADSVSAGMAGASAIRRRQQGDESAPALMDIPGIGTVDPKLVHEMYMASYAAGMVSVNPLRVRLIILNGSTLR